MDQKIVKIFVGFAVAGMLAGCNSKAPNRTPISNNEHPVSMNAKAETDLHHCKGKNECKGLGGCKSESHGCKGMNECKGQGGCVAGKLFLIEASGKSEAASTTETTTKSSCSGPNGCGAKTDTPSKPNKSKGKASCAAATGCGAKTEKGKNSCSGPNGCGAKSPQ